MMGDIADDIMENYFDQMFDYDEDGYYPDYRKKKKKKFQPDDQYKWKDGNNKVWDMWEMKQSHIRNCIKFLENSEQFPDKVLALKEVLFEKERTDGVDIVDERPKPVQKSYKKSGLFNSNNKRMLDDDIPF